jgi:hypothetical protein
MAKPLVLSLRVLPKPDLTKLDAIQQHQFQYLQAYASPDESLRLTEFFAVHDGSGAHVYDMHLFCGEDGQVFVKGSKKRVAGFAQGDADCIDKRLGEALDAALEGYTPAPIPPAAPKAAPVKEPAKKKPAPFAKPVAAKVAAAPAKKPAPAKKAPAKKPAPAKKAPAKKLAPAKKAAPKKVPAAKGKPAKKANARR